MTLSRQTNDSESFPYYTPAETTIDPKYYEPLPTEQKVKKPRRFIPVIFAIVLATAAVLVGMFFLNGSLNAIGTDSGVAACQQMADNVSKKTPSSNVKMTDAQRLEKRAPFANSKYADIKVAGTNIVDTVYELDQQESTDFGSALATLSTLQTQWSQLQVACASHGVDVPALPIPKN